MHVSLRRKPFASAVVVAGIVINSQSAVAHDYQMRYDLPIPFDLYLYACAVALAVTFILFGWFMRTPAAVSRTPEVSRPQPIGRLSGCVLAVLRAGALVCLVLTLATALVGTHDPDINLGVTLFWQVFLIGAIYVTALLGNAYEFLNPWQLIVEWTQRNKADTERPRFAYPQRLAYWPALVFYIAVVWLELFLPQRPRVLAVALIVYSLLTLCGAWLFGKAAWFKYGEVFAVLLRIVGMLAPIFYRPTADGKSFDIHLRWPVVGILERRADHISLVVFVLFMLSSTTYDGMHQTVFWMGLYYNHILAALHPLWGTDLIAAQVMLEKWYVVYQRVGLMVSPFFYLAIYLGVLRLVKAITRTALPLHSLALEFAFSIVPIALVYNLAHYYTLILTRVPALPYLLLSDPFALGWNLLGIEPPSTEPPVFNMAAVWHVEVALIVVGHVISVYLSHRVALRLFGTRRGAVVSQIPMLALMMAYTTLGLWVISLPFALIS
jgi:hypothetical protein